MGLACIPADIACSVKKFQAEELLVLQRISNTDRLQKIVLEKPFQTCYSHGQNCMV